MSTRMSADERREQVIRAAVSEFAVRGLEGATTADIAKRVGVSQPYLFRLFPNKKALFIAAARRSVARTIEVMEEAAGDMSGGPALEAMGTAYIEMIETDREQLLMLLQQYAACHDPEIQDEARDGLNRVWTAVERITGLPIENRVAFFAQGMLCNVVAAVAWRGTLAPAWLPVLDALKALNIRE